MEIRIGRIKHYWPKAGAAEVALEGMNIQVGDQVHIRGHGRDFIQTVRSIEIEHEPRTVGHPSEPVAFAVKEPVHENDEVYLVRRSEGKE